MLIAGTTHQTHHGFRTGLYRFDVDSLPEGVATIGFFYPTMDSLGITPPVRQMAIHHGHSAVADLGVPSMRTVLRVICRDSVAEGRGMMMGIVSDAQTDAPVVGALVVVMWTEMNIGSNSLTKLPKATHTTVDAHGAYRLCGLPEACSCARRPGSARRRADGSTWPASGRARVIQRDFLVGERIVAAARPDSQAGAH